MAIVEKAQPHQPLDVDVVWVPPVSERINGFRTAVLEVTIRYRRETKSATLDCRVDREARRPARTRRGVVTGAVAQAAAREASTAVHRRAEKAECSDTTS